MKQSSNINHYKEKIIELADKLLEKEKECSYLSALKSVHEMRIEALEKQLTDDKRYKDLIEHIEQQDNKITSLIKERDNYRDLFESSDKLVTEKQFEINGLTRKFSEILDRCFHAEKQRDNYKNDYEYVEECFQAEREARYKLEDEIKVLKGQKAYPCISLECNDITSESSSLYFCFSYDDKVLLANNVPRLIFKSYFQIHASVNRLGLTYHITCPHVLNPKTDKPYVYFKVLHDTKQLLDYDRPLDWMNYCNNKSNKDIEYKEFQRYCFLGVNNRLHLCVSANKFILLDRQPEDWVQKSDRWKIVYDDITKEGLVQIYDTTSIKAVTYYIENGRKINKIIGEQV